MLLLKTTATVVASLGFPLVNMTYYLKCIRILHTGAQKSSLFRIYEIKARWVFQSLYWLNYCRNHKTFGAPYRYQPVQCVNIVITM